LVFSSTFSKFFEIFLYLTFIIFLTNSNCLLMENEENSRNDNDEMHFLYEMSCLRKSHLDLSSLNRR
jgi:hypothetical protein